MRIMRIIGIVTIMRDRTRITLGVLIAAVRADELLRSSYNIVVVPDEPWLIDRRRCDAFASSSTGAHTVAVVSITVCTAAPGSLQSLVTGSI